MSTVVSAGRDKSFGPISPGTHLAVCISVIDLGVQEEEWQGKANKVPRLLLTWEISDETIILEGREVPRTISKEYTASIGKKSTLRQHLEMWRSKPFTDEELRGFKMARILGKPCQLSIIQKENNGNTRAQIGAVMAAPKGMELPKAVHPLTHFNLEDPGFMSVYGTLPGWVQEKIQKSETYQELIAAQVDADEEILPEEEDLPF